jgi:hypothetical protein
VEALVQELHQALRVDNERGKGYGVKKMV